MLERVRALRGVSWEWRDASHGDGRRRQIGVIAQDVERVFPEAVLQDHAGRLMVDYAGLVGALVEAVKELADRLEALEAERRD